MAGAHAEDVDLENVVGSLVAAEKAYAKLTAEKGFREASSKGRDDRETLTRFCHSGPFEFAQGKTPSRMERLGEPRHGREGRRLSEWDVSESNL